MRILIVGAQGMLGQELIRVFSDADVLAQDRPEIDITDPDGARARVISARPDILVNAAAYTAVDRAEAEEHLANAVNGTAVGTLARVAADLGATFVHYSTDYVFSGCREPSGSPQYTLPSHKVACPRPASDSGQSPTAIGLGFGLRSEIDGYAEDAEPHPVNAYGRSKLLGERALAEVAATHPTWRWFCIRTSRLHGAPGSGGGAKRSFVDVMREQGATRDRIEVVDAETASPTYAPDLAAATRALIAGAPPGVYHRTNDGSCTWYEFAREIFRITGWSGTLVPIPASAYPRPAVRPVSSILRTTKLPPMRRWEDALREYLAER